MKQKRTLVILGTIITCLTACGGANSTHGGGNTASASISPTGTAQIAGCSPRTDTTTLRAPDRIVTDHDADSLPEGSAITLHSGQIIEIRLPSVMKWHVMPEDSPVLKDMTMQGWYDAGNRACIWRYTAAAEGSRTLSFTGTPICPGEVACPAIARLVRLSIVVQP